MIEVILAGTPIQIRHAEPSDHQSIINVINHWWGGRAMEDMLPKLFFVHFSETSFVAEKDQELIGFLNGFFSQTYSDRAYIHFVGIHPNFRKLGIGRTLYEHFFTVAQEHRRNFVYCVTSPTNKFSIAFHIQMGFSIILGSVEVDGISVHRNYDGHGEDRVLFFKKLSYSHSK